MLYVPLFLQIFLFHPVWLKGLQPFVGTTIDSLVERLSLELTPNGLACDQLYIHDPIDHLTTETDLLTSNNDRLTSNNDRLTVKSDRLPSSNGQLTTETDSVTAPIVHITLPETSDHIEKLSDFLHVVALRLDPPLNISRLERLIKKVPSSVLVLRLRYSGER